MIKNKYVRVQRVSEGSGGAKTRGGTQQTRTGSQGGASMEIVCWWRGWQWRRREWHRWCWYVTRVRCPPRWVGDDDSWRGVETSGHGTTHKTNGHINITRQARPQSKQLHTTRTDMRKCLTCIGEWVGYGGAWMRMNDWDRRSGAILYGVTQKTNMWGP